MSFTRKIIKAASYAIAAFSMAHVACAATTTTFNVLDGNGNVLAANVSAFDWAESGSGLARNIGLPSSLEEGQTFNFEYQAKLGNYTVGAGVYSGSLNAAYEITVSASIGEIVSSVVHKPDGNTAVEFKATGGILKIYYSTVVNADVAAGTGFTDGILIGTFNVRPGGNSTLTTFADDAGGFTSYSLDAVMASVNSAYLTASSGITGMNFTSSQTLQTGTSDTAAVNGYASSSGVLLKVDGSSFLTTSAANVPEPGVLALMSLGLVGLGIAARGRRSAS